MDPLETLPQRTFAMPLSSRRGTLFPHQKGWFWQQSALGRMAVLRCCSFFWSEKDHTKPNLVAYARILLPSPARKLPDTAKRWRISSSPPEATLRPQAFLHTEVEECVCRSSADAIKKLRELFSGSRKVEAPARRLLRVGAALDTPDKSARTRGGYFLDA